MLGPAYAIAHFSGRALGVFATLSALILANGIAAGLFRHRWWAVLGIAISLAACLVLHISLLSGMISSNTGTYFRETEPIRFWISCAVVFVGVVFPSIAVWFM